MVLNHHYELPLATQTTSGDLFAFYVFKHKGNMFPSHGCKALCVEDLMRYKAQLVPVNNLLQLLPLCFKHPVAILEILEWYQN